MRNDPDLGTEPKTPFGSFEEATHYLEMACAKMGVNHLSYALMRSAQGTMDTVAWIATYDPAYMSYYMANYTQLGDPAIEAAFAEGKVMDWVEMAAVDPTSQELFPVAGRYGITKFGISIPLRDGPTDNVLFSVNVKCSDAEWPLLRGSLEARFRPLALYFHRRTAPLVDLREAAEINALI
jgi:hypothetical protein